jgi:L-seryl-tRNA(Ser) seleniumtransferase
VKTELFRQLPSVEQLLQTSAVTALVEAYGRPLVLESLRHILDGAREAIRGGRDEPFADADLVAQAESRLVALTAPTLRPVINATGVIVHTNLGRAPLSTAARQAVETAARSYNTLEYDLTSGVRGSRSVHAQGLLARLVGAEAATVVNNNAAAVLLTLTALAHGREVIISRGQLVEIGGSFRIPDVMAQSGARLVEVGATNRTHLHDYERAITEDTAAIMVAHHSNFKIVGFTSEPALAELAALAHDHGLYLLHDLGSGTLIDTAPFGLAHEPTVQESLADGADVATFSGDKLLGGPQAGLIVGRAELLERIKRHPLARAVRPDKLCLAGLSATLLHYLRDEALSQIPIWRMIAASEETVRATAHRWVDDLRASGWQAEAVLGESMVGGGSLPGTTLPTWLVGLHHPSPSALGAELRAGATPVIGRIEDDRFLLDPRTVLPEQGGPLLDILRALAARHGHTR